MLWINKRQLHHDADQKQSLQLLDLCCCPYACRLLAAVFVLQLSHLQLSAISLCAWLQLMAACAA